MKTNLENKKAKPNLEPSTNRLTSYMKRKLAKTNVNSDIAK